MTSEKENTPKAGEQDSETIEQNPESIELTDDDTLRQAFYSAHPDGMNIEANTVFESDQEAYSEPESTENSVEKSEAEGPDDQDFLNDHPEDDAEFPESDNADLDIEISTLQEMADQAPESITLEMASQLLAQEQKDANERSISAPDPDTLNEEDLAGYSLEQLKNIVEGLVFAAGKAINLDRIREIFEEGLEPSKPAIRVALAELQSDYKARGIQLVEVASGFRFQTSMNVSDQVIKLWDEKPARYSRALLETLALVAYRQPITRGEIEDVRGVSVSSHIVKTLQERDWIRVVGHRDVPGRPAMFATTRGFLDYFGLKTLDELPSLSELKDLEDLNPELGLEDSGVDPDRETSFSEMVDKLKEGTEQSEEQDYIDNELKDDLAAMDEVNKGFEDMLEAQRQSLREQAEAEASVEKSSEQVVNGEDQIDPNTVAETTFEPEPHLNEQTTASELPSVFEQPNSELSEEEQIAIIQAKLAEQAALLNNKESEEDDHS